MADGLLIQDLQEEEDRRKADQIYQQVVADNVQSWRFRTLVNMNPYMANSPETLFAMSSMNIPDSDLFRQAGEIYGMSTANSLAMTLPRYSESYQRAIYNSLSSGQQMTLMQMGYQVPEKDEQSGGFWDALGTAARFAFAPLRGVGTVAAPVVSPVFNAMGIASEIPNRALRTIRQLDGADQWIALALGVAAIAATPFTFGASGSLGFAAMSAFGMRGLAGLAAATAGAAVSSGIRNKSLAPFANAWSEAANGERLFTASGRQKAQDLLKNPELQTLAEQLALYSNKVGDLADVARDIVGVRGGGQQAVQVKQLAVVAAQYADEGTPEYAQVYGLLSELLTQPLFVEALSVLERSKISWGRDLVRGLNVLSPVDMESSDGVGRWISGGFDAFMRVWLDPFNFLGGAYRGYAFARRGIPSFTSHADVAGRLDDLFTLPEIRRKWEVVAQAVEAGDMDILARGAKEFKPAFASMRKHMADNNMTTFTVEDVRDWMIGESQLSLILKGVGLTPGMKYHQLKGLNRTQAFINRATQDARDVLRGVADIGIETGNFARLFEVLANHPDLQQQLAEHLSNVDQQFVDGLVAEGLSEESARLVGVMMRNQDVKAVLNITDDQLLGAYETKIVEEAQQFVLKKLQNSSEAFRFGRQIGKLPGGQILRPLASFVDGVTTTIPRGYVPLVGDEAGVEIEKFIEQFRIISVPSYVRSAWKAAIIDAPTGGARLAGLSSFLDSIATASGMRLTEEGNALLDKYLYKIQHIYSADELGRYSFEFDPELVIPSGVLPDADMATRFAVPDLHEIRRAASQAKLLNALMGVPESATWLGLQNRIWKPLALLRLGFMIRNIGEEVFATLMRYGTTNWMSEFVATQQAQRQLFKEADLLRVEGAIRNLAEPLTIAQAHALTSRWDIPMIYRPVARAIDRLHGGQIWQQKLYDQLDFLSRYFRESGARAAARWDAGLAGTAGFGERLRTIAGEQVTPLANVSTRREGFERMWKKLAFGNDYSLRRMLIGGVDLDLVKRAYGFERYYASQLLAEIGTTRLAPYEAAQVGPTVKAVIGGEDITDENIQLVQSYSERILATRDGGVPEQQPFWNAVVDRVTRVFDDDIVGRSYGPVVKFYNRDIQAVLPPDQLQNLFRPFAELVQSDLERIARLTPEQIQSAIAAGRSTRSLTTPSVIDGDLLDLWVATNAGVFDKSVFNATLRRMEISPERIAELEALPPIRVGDEMLDNPLLRWAKQRNELIKQIRLSFPGEIQPTWMELDAIYRETLGLDVSAWIPEPSSEWPGLVKEFVPHTGAKTRFEQELNALANASQIVEPLPSAAKYWVANNLKHWQVDPDFIPHQSMLAPAGTPKRPPSPIFYRGVSNTETFEIDEFGNLLIYPTKQSHWHGRAASSWSMSQLQASSYARGGNVNAKSGEFAVVLGVRLDDLTRTLDFGPEDFKVGSYLSDENDVLINRRNRYNLVRMQGPGVPFDSSSPNSFTSAEFALIDNHPGMSIGQYFRSRPLDAVNETVPAFEDTISSIEHQLIENRLRAVANQDDEMASIARFLEENEDIANEISNVADAILRTIIDESEDKLPTLRLATSIMEEAGALDKVLLTPTQYVQHWFMLESDESLSLVDLITADVALHLMYKMRSFGFSEAFKTYDANFQFSLHKLLLDDTVPIQFLPIMQGPETAIVIPKGMWDAQPLAEDVLYYGNAPRSATYEALMEHRTPNSNWPFYETQDEVRQAMQANVYDVVGSGEFTHRLELNPRWHGVGNGNTFYLVDTRGLKFKDAAPILPAAQFTFNEEPNVVLAAAIRQSPIIVKTQDEARVIQNYLAGYSSVTPQIQVMDVAPNENQLQNLVPYKLDNVPANSSGMDEIEIYGWNQADRRLLGRLGENEAGVDEWIMDLQDLYSRFPAIWTWLDEVAEAPQNTVVDTMLDNLFRTIGAGRRTRLEYRSGKNVPEVWRNFGGVSQKLEPGDLINLDDELYLSPSLVAESKVSPTDRRIALPYMAEYEGENEVMWSIVAPTMMDRIDGATNRIKTEPKTPIQVPTLEGGWAEVPQVKRRLRYTTKKNVEITPAGDLPDVEVAQLYKPLPHIPIVTKAESVSQRLFNTMGKIINAVSRKPMAFHAFNIAAERNKSLVRWLIEMSPNEKELQNFVSVVPPGGFTLAEVQLSEFLGQAAPEFVVPQTDSEITGRIAEIGQLLGLVSLKNPDEAAQWSVKQSLAFVRGLDDSEFNDLVSVVENAIKNDTPIRARFQDKEFRIVPLLDWARRFADGKSFVERINLTPLFDDVDSLLFFVEKNFPEVFKGATPVRRYPATEGTNALRNNAINWFEHMATKVYGGEYPEASISRMWNAFRKGQTQRLNVDDEAMRYAAEHAIRDVMPFVDSHEIRSQYAEYMRGLLPFWYAEENFLKRWGKILTEGGVLPMLQRLERLRLTYMGLQSVGIVRSDSQGNDYFVYPGSELLAEVVDKTFGKALGSRLNPDLSVLFQSPTDMILPGFQQEWGRPSVTPLLTAPMALLASIQPEFRPIDEALVGKDYVHRGVLERIVPASVMRVFQAIQDVTDNEGLNPKNERTAAAMLAAMAHLDASGNGLPEDATTAQRDDFIRRIREHARIIVISQALAGYILPGPPAPLQLVDGTSLDWITGGQIDNPAELLSAEYYELISNMGIEKGTIRFLELNGNARLKDILNPLAYTVSRTYSKSGAPLPTTEESIRFYLDNQSTFDTYPNAGPWLLPQDEGDARSQFAYDAEMIAGLRDTRTPVEFMNALKYREGANEYFIAQNDYEKRYADLKASGAGEAARALKDRWLNWSASFKASRPIFAEMLESGDARQRRQATIDQMRMAIKDPQFPKADHFDALKQLQESYDAFTIARGRLGLDRTNLGETRLNALKSQFAAWVQSFIELNPSVSSYWVTVLQPEAGLD